MTKTSCLDSRVFTGDCIESGSWIAEGSIDLVFTSPPYPLHKDCKIGVEEWIKFFSERFEVIARLVKENGVIAINLMFPRKNGFFDISLYTFIGELAKNNGMKIVDVYVWDKKNPMPSGNLSKCDINSWEPIFVMSRSMNFTFNPTRSQYSIKTIGKCKPGNRVRSTGIDGKSYSGGHSEINESGAMQTNVISLSSTGGKPRPRAIGGSFPVELAQRFVMQYTNEREIVFDPFCGVGSTLIASIVSGRYSIGVELKDSDANKAREWISDIMSSDLFGF